MFLLDAPNACFWNRRDRRSGRSIQATGSWDTTNNKSDEMLTDAMDPQRFNFLFMEDSMVWMITVSICDAWDQRPGLKDLSALKFRIAYYFTAWTVSLFKNYTFIALDFFIYFECSVCILAFVQMCNIQSTLLYVRSTILPFYICYFCNMCKQSMQFFCMHVDLEYCRDVNIRTMHEILYLTKNIALYLSFHFQCDVWTGNHISHNKKN